MGRCAGRARHWFTIWGTVGLRSPVCTACGAPNPRPLSDDEWAALISCREARGYPFMDDIENAIIARTSAQPVPADQS